MFIEAYQPRTFRERGVSAPFTTPLLGGVRLRAAPSRSGHVLEIIIPNPAGRRGVYIVPWSERGDLCRPTVHDTRLGNALAAHADLASLSPSMVRHAGLVVAAEGHAGRTVAAKARRLLRDGQARLTAASAHLEAVLDKHGAGAVVDPAARERLAALLADIHSPGGPPARLPVLIEAIGALAASLTDWAAAQPGLAPVVLQPGPAAAAPAEQPGPATVAARAVATAAALMHHGAQQLLQAAVARLDSPATLLRDWFADPAAMEQSLGRAEWLLDGWDRQVLLWRAALPGPAAAVLEMAALLPVWPDEAESWLNLPAGTAARLARRPVPPSRPWSDPVIALDQIARNERLRALES